MGEGKREAEQVKERYRGKEIEKGEKRAGLQIERRKSAENGRR